MVRTFHCLFMFNYNSLLVNQFCLCLHVTNYLYCIVINNIVKNNTNSSVCFVISYNPSLNPQHILLSLDCRSLLPFLLTDSILSDLPYLPSDLKGVSFLNM